jgi:hypothetical protein
MIYALAADLLVVLHMLFVLFVAVGGLLTLRWPAAAWTHLPAAAWGAAIELGGCICPLTLIENSLRRGAGEAGYRGGFVEHYIVPLVYPPGLTRDIQIGIGFGVLALNALVYGIVLYRLRRGRRRGSLFGP